ncbi:electron transfer flavoprotein alpha subunit apoprotein [Litorimonas taeanensis]|uniref:Electron transfer flavoprotein subunit alpha n=1 Tax=Litorimonas taeanensis TaxID=568099 RepID=A0A420WM52_9PROT|nr:electron transfer flavoprotein subunit alpha/FixB family protein [Litorimonas taeanensis]RKQ72118.1 electron transfer flavoprotein alpha subunit apoprotein [Litorimonas taeanensis]
MAILVVAEHDNESLKDATHKTVTAALAMGGDVDVVVAGKGVKDVMAQAVKIEGVRAVLGVDHESLRRQLAESMEEVLVPLMAEYDAILAPDTTTHKNYMPRVAAKLDVQQISSITGVESADTFIRPIYAGNAMATVQSTDAKKCITVRTTAFNAAGESGSASDKMLDDPKGPFKSAYIGEELSKSDRPELTAAKVVISGGRGMGSGENFKLIEGIADKLGAAMGASRAAVDAGFVPNDWQVGQTGKAVAPELYIAVGISGAIQHLAGMKDSKVIVAINKDEDAPIFSVADYGLVADLFKALPELEAELGKAGY